MRARFLPRPRRVAVVALVGCMVATGAFFVAQASGANRLPKVRPATLLADTMRALSHPISLSGQVSADWNVARAGIRYPGLLQHASFRIWRSDQGLRVAEILPFGEHLVVAKPSVAWLWDSQTMTARRLASSNITTDGTNFSPSITADPFALARSVLNAVAPYSTVTVSGTATIAGHAAYLLNLTTDQRHTHVRRIVLGVDATTHLPLLFEFFNRPSGPPAVAIRFTSVSFHSVNPSLFSFTPPKHATVVPTPVFAGRALNNRPVARSTLTFGRGWRTVVAWKLSRDLSSGAVGAFPLWNAVGSATEVTRHGKTWILGGFQALPRVERYVRKLP
jgi:outer membrane lipoprotein-sorting protein